MHEFLHSLWRQKIRALSTLFGVAWGTLSVVLLLAFGYGLRNDLREKAQALGANIVVVWPQQTTKPYAGFNEGRRLRLRAQDLLKLPKLIPELEAISPEYMDYETLQLRDRVHRVQLSGVYPAFGELRSMTPASGGRFINQQDINEKRRVVFLGNRIKTNLFDTEGALGQLLVLRGISFKVIGVLAPKQQDSNYGGLDQDRIYLPATTHAQLFSRNVISDFVYRAKSLALHEVAKDRVHEVLGRMYQFDPTDRSVLNTWDTTENERLRSHIFLGFNIVLGGSGILILLIGGIGLANLMYILVRQRTHEIGILMALGARPNRILLELLGQTQILVFAGGLLGLLGSFFIINLVKRTSLTEQIGVPTVSPQLGILTVFLLALVGLIAGYFPARRAALLDPARVLSEE
jgi:putative ABC transport system permease protein